MKIQIKIESDEKDDITRTLLADEAFSLLSEVDEKARAMLKYGEDYSRCLEEIRELIHGSGLMEFYN